MSRQHSGQLWTDYSVELPLLPADEPITSDSVGYLRQKASFITKIFFFAHKYRHLDTDDHVGGKAPIEMLVYLMKET